MSNKQIAIYHGALIAIGVVMCAILLGGCEGGDETAGYGGARGYVCLLYTSDAADE